MPLLQRGTNPAVEVAFVSAPDSGNGCVWWRWELTSAAVQCSISSFASFKTCAAGAAMCENRRKFHMPRL